MKTILKIILLILLQSQNLWAVERKTISVFADDYIMTALNARFAQNKYLNTNQKKMGVYFIAKNNSLIAHCGYFTQKQYDKCDITMKVAKQYFEQYIDNYKLKDHLNWQTNIKKVTVSEKSFFQRLKAIFE